MTANLVTRAGLALILSLSFSALAVAGGTPKEVGIWYDDTGKGAVRVELCGAKLCGTIYWLKDKVNAEGKPLVDKHNPNEGERVRPICGLPVFGGVAKMNDGTWDSGWIYDPKEGKSYSVAMQLADQDTLKVTGYLVMKLMGRTLTWKRAPDDLPSCAATAAQAPAQAGAAKVGATGVAAPASRAAAQPAEAAPVAKPIAAPATKPAAAAVSPKAVAKPAVAKAQKPAAKPATAKASTGEVLPWANKKAPAAAKPAAEASKSSGQ